MTGITSSVGIFSGIDSGSLIEQLLGIESRSKLPFQRRIVQLQSQQAAFLDINSRLNTLQTAAAKFRTNKSFDLMRAASSDEDILTATTTTGAQPGSYKFTVDRLVTTRQLLTRGFADRDSTAIGLSSVTIESGKARVDNNLALADLNGGLGIERGKFSITQNSITDTIDLSRVANIDEVLTALNNSSLNFTATISNGKIVLASNDANTLTVADLTGSTTASSLGLLSTSNGTATVSGNSIYSLASNTSLVSLNDNNGVFINNDSGNAAFDFTITVDSAGTPTIVNINLGDLFEFQVNAETGENELIKTASRVTTLGAAIARINLNLSDAGFSDITAAVNADGQRIDLIDSTGGRTNVVADKNITSSTAADLGIDGTFSGTLTGNRVLSGLNTRLLNNLNGGTGISAGIVLFTQRDSGIFSIDTTGMETLTQVVDAINTNSGGDVIATINDAGTGLLLTDSTGGTGNLIVSGNPASELGIETAGVASNTLRGTNLQFRYISAATPLNDLNGGSGIGVGEIRITDATSASTTIKISDSLTTVGQLLDQINGQLSANSAGTRIQARINDTGDGILIEEISPTPGPNPIKVEDVEGAVGKNLNIAGTATGTNPNNFIDGSYETTITFTATDTLDDIKTKINDLGLEASLSIINDGAGSNPFRLSIVAANSGAKGRFIFDTKGFDLGLDTLDEGDDARVFFGSSDPANGVLISSSTNSLDGVITGVSIDLAQTTSTPVNLTITQDNEALETDIQEFIDAYNGLIERIDAQSRFDPETEVRGALLSDSTVASLRNRLFTDVLGTGKNIGGRFPRLVSIGISIGTDSKLEFDKDRFRAALAEDPDAVEEILAARDLDAKDTVIDLGDGVTVTIPPGENDDTFSRLGVAAVLEELAKDYINSVDGILTRRGETIDSQITTQEDRIAAIDLRLENRRVILGRQFLAMEQAIGRLQNQSASLGSIGQLG